MEVGASLSLLIFYLSVTLLLCLGMGQTIVDNKGGHDPVDHLEDEVPSALLFRPFL